MMNSVANLRKAAVLLRSVDADTAATLLAQLSNEEAAALREAMRGLGPVAAEEQADVLAQFRREQPPAKSQMGTGVELSLSSSEDLGQPAPLSVADPRGKRFEFLTHASAKTLASYLSREHAQTIAVVLSHLPPQRAAAVLAALPAKVQADTMERLSNLGETDTEAMVILENELAAWVRTRYGGAGARGGRRDTVSSILAAADAETHDAIVATMKSQRPELIERLKPIERNRSQFPRKPHNDEYRVVRSIAKRHEVNAQLRALMPGQSPAPHPRYSPRPEPALPRIDFDNLIHLESRMLARLLEVADPNLLALALAGSKDELVDRVCDQMPKRIAKAFRRELRRMGATRLSDVEAAQRAIADLATRQIAGRRGLERSSPGKC